MTRGVARMALRVLCCDPCHRLDHIKGCKRVHALTLRALRHVLDMRNAFLNLVR